MNGNAASGEFSEKRGDGGGRGLARTEMDSPGEALAEGLRADGPRPVPR